MNTTKNLIALGVAVAIAPGVALCAAQEEDSAYQWGRWAVLSPAAGGEPYIAALTPDAANNARPGDADEFDPNVLFEDGGDNGDNGDGGPVEVVESCTAGASCGFATYSRQQDESPKAGPMLASFDLSSREISEPGSTEVGEGPTATITEFAVTDSGHPDFPDVDSVELNGAFEDGGPDISGTQATVAVDSDIGAIVTDAGTSTLSHSNQDTSQVYDFDGVDAGYWSHLAQRQLDFILGEQAGTTEIVSSSDSDGYFVHGVAATIEEMEAFAAGRVSAAYNGFVLDYGSPVQLNFDFSQNTFNGNFATANGFNGFNIDGAVNGVNFSAEDSGREVVGSFFNGGFNASGAVNNGSQLGVFSTDYSGSTVEASR